MQALLFGLLPLPLPDPPDVHQPLPGFVHHGRHRPQRDHHGYGALPAAEGQCAAAAQCGRWVQLRTLLLFGLGGRSARPAHPLALLKVPILHLASRCLEPAAPLRCGSVRGDPSDSGGGSAFVSVATKDRY